MRLLLIAIFSFAVTSAHGQAWLLHTAAEAIRKPAPQTPGKPPAEAPDRARDGAQR